jgi:hypothetical protein
MLIEWARWHVATGSRLSSPRSLAVAEAAPGAWRLWQIVGRAPTLTDRIGETLRSADRRIGERLLELVDSRLRAERELGGGSLPELSLAAIATTERGEPVFAGAAPYPPPALGESSFGIGSADGVEGDGSSAGSVIFVPETALELRLVQDEVAPALADALRPTPARLAALLAGLEHAGDTPERRRRASLLRGALLKA